jgi:hypothetical protein
LSWSSLSSSASKSSGINSLALPNSSDDMICQELLTDPNGAKLREV